MDALMGYLEGLGNWNWLFLAIVLFALETIVPGVHFLWFGLAALIVGLLGFAGGDMFTWPFQLVAFATLAVIMVFWVKRYARPNDEATDAPDLNVRGAQYIGRRVVVEDAIAGGRGKVRVGDTIWGAEGEDAPRGANVEVTGVNGTNLVVTKYGED